MTTVPDVRTTVRSSGDLWRDKEELARREHVAWQYWASIDDETRRGLCLVVLEHLTRLSCSIDAWLPSSVTPSGSSTLEIAIRVDLPALEEATLALVRSAMELRAETERRLLAMEKELRG